jgi:hypothetical protein
LMYFCTLQRCLRSPSAAALPSLLLATITFIVVVFDRVYC